MKKCVVDLGHTCNNNCVFCSVGDKKGTRDKTTEEAKINILALRKKGYESIEFIGGEPTIRKDIIQIVSFAKELGFVEISFESNGRMFSYLNFCKLLKKAGLTYVNVSLHGHCEEIQDSITQTKNSFKEAKKGLANLIEYELLNNINLVITQKNLHHIIEFVEFAKQIGIRKILFLVLNPIGSAKGKNELMPRLKDIANVFEKIESKGIKIFLKNMPLCISPKILELAYRNERDTSILIGDKVYSMPKNIENLKIKGEVCKNCKKNIECGGVWGGYCKIYGFSEISAYN